MGCGQSQSTLVVKSTSEVQVRGEDGATYDVLVIGGGAAGIAAAGQAKNKGLTVKLVEANNRLGGRICTENMGGLMVDLGANFIWGQGPVCGELEEWKEIENPVYTACKTAGIQMIKPWEDKG